jgi:hypothetical protein
MLDEVSRAVSVIPFQEEPMKRTYTSPTLAPSGDLVAATNNSIGLGGDSFTKRVPAGSVGFLL